MDGEKEERRRKRGLYACCRTCTSAAKTVCWAVRGELARTRVLKNLGKGEGCVMEMVGRPRVYGMLIRSCFGGGRERVKTRKGEVMTRHV